MKYSEDKYDAIESKVEVIMAILKRLEDEEETDPSIMRAEEAIQSALMKLLDLSSQESLRSVICPQCRKDFRLTMNETVNYYDCPSGGVYSMFIDCPHCDFKENL